MNDDEPPLTTILLDEEQAKYIRLNHESGALDLPLSVVRSLAEWLRRYDLRPKPKGKPGTTVFVER